jgi:hypothetical protein
MVSPLPFWQAFPDEVSFHAVPLTGIVHRDVFQDLIFLAGVIEPWAI